MKILLSTVLFTLLGSLSPVFSQGHYADGEELVYAAKWTGVPAGEITMKTKRLGPNRLKFTLEAKTNRFWSMVHRVEDLVTSEVEESPFASQVYYKDARQGRRHIEELAEMDYGSSKVKRRKQNHSAGEAAYTEFFDMPSGVTRLQDPFSMIYFLRQIDYSRPEALSEKFHVFASKGVYEINFKMLGEVNFKSSIFGDRRAWNLEPSAEYEGSLVSKGRLEMWVDCETGIPLRLMFHIPVGWATLELKSCNHPQLPSVSFRQRRRR